MKRIILLLISGIFLISFVGAVECELATPRYGVVQCMNSGQTETIYSSFGGFDGEWSSIEISCLSNCQISSKNDISIYCEGVPWDVKEVYKNGIEKDISSPVLWNRDDSLIVKGKCTTLFTNYPVPDDARVEYQQDKIMLYEGWAGSLPNTPISGSEGCILNKNYNEEDISSYLNPSTGEIENKPSSSYSSLNQFPNNWEINDHYTFVKDWQTGIADISLTYDKNNNPYWCGGQYGSRKIYNVQEVTSQSGQCYAIPQSIYLSNIECCFPSDCINIFGAEYTCNPDTWKCEETKPCNSQLECDSVFGEGVCQNNQINKWVCDLTKKWGDYAGTCIHSSKQVSECPSDCSSKEYYNEEEGKCLLRAGLKSEEINDSSEGITGAATSEMKSGSSTGTIILIVFLVLIGGSVAYYIYSKKSKKELSRKVKQEVEIRNKKYCKKCGGPLKPKSKFCSKCGKKV